MEENLWSLVSRTVNQSGGIEKAVFFLLLGFSLVSWCLMFVKFYDIYVARRNGIRFLELFDGADRFGSIMNTLHTVGVSPLANIFKAGMGALENRRISANVVSDPRQISVNPESSPEEMMLMSMQHTAGAEYGKLQKGLGFLATIGSTSPFIGLFGTVWGIMHTFRDLSNMKSASIAVVAPGISASLIATAAGLAVAIPAVMAYNWLLAQIEGLEDQGDVFIERVSAIVRASGVMSTKPQATGAIAHPPAAVDPAKPAPHPAPAHVPGQYMAQPSIPTPAAPAVSPTTLGAK